jgi:hypothetical protein
MHDGQMARRRLQRKAAPARQLEGLLLVAPLRRKKNARDLGKLLDKDAADSIAQQSGQPGPSQTGG